MRAGVLAVRAGIVDAHEHGVRLLAGARRSPLVTHVADDQASVAEPSCERWFSPIRTRSSNPNAAVSHSTASRTSGYTSTGTTVADGIERLERMAPSLRAANPTFVSGQHAAD